MATGKYVMMISRLTIDKLGVNPYDRVSAFIAELGPVDIIRDGLDARGAALFAAAGTPA